MKWLLAIVLLVAACREGTAVVVRVDRGDVQIPSDVASLHVRVTNPEFSATPFDSQTLSLCDDTAKPGCYSLPLTLALRPGSEHPDALVRAEVIALDATGTQVIDDAAEFHFTDEHELTLDFYLSEQCLMSACAASGQICGRNGGCEIGTPTTTSTPDLAVSASGPVTFVAETAGQQALYPSVTSVVVGPLVGLLPGDYVVGAFQYLNPPPSGWQQVAYGTAGGAAIYLHLVRGVETAEDYRFSISAMQNQSWMYAVYRGASKPVFGTTSGTTTDGKYDFESLDAPAGSVLTTLFVTTGVSPGCSSTEGETLFDQDDEALDQTSISTTGPTGTHVYDCPNSVIAVAAQILLVP